MLEQIRKSGASVFVYLIFGLLIVIFVINFAPNAGSGQGGGCAGSNTSMVTVDGVTTNPTAYKVAYSGNGANGRQKVYAALDLVIRRELLAQAAEDRGLRVTQDLLDEEIKKGAFFLGGFRNELKLWMEEIDGEKFFNFKMLRQWVANLNVTMNAYKEEQARNLQASLMADLLASSVRVSREEALSAYLFENDTVKYDAVAFSPEPYRAAMRLSDADLARFVSTHEAEVKAKWTEVEREYKATKPSFKLRAITIATVAPPPAPTPPATQPIDSPVPGTGSAAAPTGAGSAAPPAAGSAPPAAGSAAPPAAGSAAPPTKPADAKPADAKLVEKPTGMAVEEAKAKLEAARAQITAGKLKFADAAKQLSSDEAAKASGGEIGWRPIENAQMGDKAVNDAIKALKPGEMTPVITTESGVTLVLAEDKREGDLTFDQVKNELAVDLAKDIWSKEAAKRAALEALAAANAGTGKTLEQLFERQRPAMDPQQIDIQKMIDEQLKKQQQGALSVESKDVPAAWLAEDSAAPPVAGSAAGGSAPAPSAPAARSAPVPAAGSAPAPAPATGSAASPTAAQPAAPAPVVTVVKASNDTLPAFAKVEKPKVMTHGPVPRVKALPGIGASPEAVTALFDELTPGMLGTKVYEVEGSYVLLQLIEKQAPKVDEFDKIADKEIEQMRQARANAAVNEWLLDRCEALTKDKKIVPLADLIRENDDQGKPLPTVYRPCMSFR